MMDKDTRGKTGKISAEYLERYPLIGKRFGKSFNFKDENGEMKERPYYGTIDNVIGEGGFGVVYRLLFEMHHRWRTQYKLGSYGAVKILTNEADDEYVKRFKREGSLGIELNGIPVVGAPRSLLKVVEHGDVEFKELPEGKNKFKYILMEYLDHPENFGKFVVSEPDGEKLAEELSLEDAVLATNSLVEAVDYIHKKGIAHKDVKPQNLLRDKKNGRIVLIDLGLGRRIDAKKDEEAQKSEGPSGETVDFATQVARIRGTPHYMSPEAANGKDSIYPKETDVWGVGATAYALFAGFPPYIGSSKEISAYHAIAKEVSIPDDNIKFLKRANPRVPWPFNDWIMRCLEKELEKRTRSEDLKRKWEAAVEESGFKDHIMQSLRGVA